jgi:hypothetical protein
MYELKTKYIGIVCHRSGGIMGVGKDKWSGSAMAGLVPLHATDVLQEAGEWMATRYRLDRIFHFPAVPVVSSQVVLHWPVMMVRTTKLSELGFSTTGAVNGDG